MELTSSFGTLLHELRPVFTVPSFTTFVALVTGWLLSHRHRFITECIFSSGSVGKGHHSNYHRFFSHAAWDLDTLCQFLARLLDDPSAAPCGPRGSAPPSPGRCRSRSRDRPRPAPPCSAAGPSASRSPGARARPGRPGRPAPASDGAEQHPDPALPTICLCCRVRTRRSSFGERILFEAGEARASRPAEPRFLDGIHVALGGAPDSSSSWHEGGQPLSEDVRVPHATQHPIQP